ncbi:MAG: 2-hydroxyacyl-CoA dehydratase subunit D [Desulfobacterales bacterium]
MQVLKQFHDIANDPIGYARSWKAETQGSVVGYFCSYAPEEIIWAAGALPYRILGAGGSISRADGHLQAYSCSLVRGALDDVLTGKLDFLDGTVFPHTCDSIQRLSDIWRLNAGIGLHLDLVLPVKLNTKSAEDYMQAVIKKFHRDLEAGLGVEITPQKLSKAIETFNQIRTGLQRLYEIRRDRCGTMNSRDLHAIVKASMVMDRNELAEGLSAVVDLLQTQDPETDTSQKRLVLTGGICSMPEIYQPIEDAGGTVVWDDFCTGSRYFEGTVDPQGNLLTSIGRRYFNRIICPAKHRDCFSRGDSLLKMVENTRAQGVIFVILKFCDPHAFDFPYIKSLLDRAGIRSMLLEIEDQQISEEQLRTRLEAFIELL